MWDKTADLETEKIVDHDKVLDKIKLIKGVHLPKLIVYRMKRPGFYIKQGTGPESESLLSRY